MKICIFETQHFEVAYPVIRLFDFPGNQITVITSYECYPRFEELFGKDLKRYNWVLLPKKKSKFFYRLYKNLKQTKPKILYLNTVSNNHILYAFILALLSLNRTILTVHDINCLFESRFAWNFRRAVIHRGKKWLVKKVDEFNVVSDTMIDYLRTKTNKKLINIPGAVYEERSSPQIIQKEIRLVVPGSLDKKRRNYEQVFELASLADTNQLHLQIILLGGYSDEYGKTIINRAAQSNYGYSTILYYDLPVVDQFEFDKQIDYCHFVFIPSVIDTNICGDIPETYGITKSSGNIFDVIKHAKPFIVPQALTISSELESGCFKYDSIKNIIEFFDMLKERPGEYGKWAEKALENSRRFSIERVRQKNSSLFG
jgi:hypothetical protein